MTNTFNGTEFTSPQAQRFAPAFEGAQAKREITSSLLARRTLRRSRRENRAL